MCETGQTAQNVDSSQEQTSRWVVVVSLLKRRIQPDQCFACQVPEGCCGWEKMEGAWQETNTTSMDVSRENIALPKISKTNIFVPSDILCRPAEKLIFPQAHHGTQTTSRAGDKMTELANAFFFYDESIANFPHKLIVKLSFDQKLSYTPQKKVLAC